MDYRVRGTGPRLWELRGVISEYCFIRCMNEDAEEGGGLIVRVRLKLRVDLDDERRSDGGEQTSLWPESAKST